jgi:hypothetical protein
MVVALNIGHTPAISVGVFCEIAFDRYDASRLHVVRRVEARFAKTVLQPSAGNIANG